MTNRLSDAISPYLRAHADNPVDWYPWGEAAFAEARRRDVPVLVSIGYSTCHWCHVMARESFSDPTAAEALNTRFVAIKVDREEHPEVDAGYLAAASAFTSNLGWPLTIFATPEGRAFFAGTYFPPQPVPGQASFSQVLDAVAEAWNERRDEVEQNAARIAEALTSAAASVTSRAAALPGAQQLDAAVDALAANEDERFGGFGMAPKFPAGPVLGFLSERGNRSRKARELVTRTLKHMAASPLRDAVEGGFFRYAVGRDWSQPHYERMLYDNAQLLDAYTTVWQGDPEATWAKDAAAGIASFLLNVMRLPSGAFASAQDSESTVDGERVEGGYYLLDAGEREGQRPPALDEKVLTGWNGLAIAALAHAGFAFAEPTWTDAARLAADGLLARHVRSDGRLVRASVGDRVSDAAATLEDYGMFAQGLLALAQVTGRRDYAAAARSLIDQSLTAGSAAEQALPFAVPGGGDPVLASRGLVIDADPSEGAYPSGPSALARAAHTLWLLTGQRRYEEAARETLGLVAELAPSRPLAFGAALALASAMEAGDEQFVLVEPDAHSHHPGSPMREAARMRPGGLTAVVSESQARELADAGFELFADRTCRHHKPTAYVCRDFVCRLPVTDPDDLADA
ncbi:thioredoxin domain-containing protein [Microbacterium sp. STN6]|uniref:thioredoxin domain-containing protein n=1 Tax=Microbacterium sp. STN6 TaxID=2995588 RepID=UPI002260F60B|nr:thioredoxin domain-containing protein [Microbacterium sp. STN6]MCX7521755.1 thioredoxin domain-containing protein [Microbacterium sp. STN6]